MEGSLHFSLRVGSLWCCDKIYTATKVLSAPKLININNKLTQAKYTLNMRPNCSTHSKTNCWWTKTFLLFMMRTIVASIAYHLYLSTSSITFLSSTGGQVLAYHLYLQYLFISQVQLSHNLWIAKSIIRKL
jgi:hypothetical protein